MVVIGQGEPERTAAYIQKHNLPCQVLCDPTYRVYQAYDLLEGKPSQIVFDAPDEFLKCNFDAGADLQKSRHATERAAVDNPWQLPGEFVVDKKGIIRLALRYQYCEDWPNPLVLIGAIKKLFGKMNSSALSQSRFTQRAPDKWESAVIPSSFLALAFFWSDGFAANRLAGVEATS